MKALLLYEPLFQYLCQVNRWARVGAPLSYGMVRTKVTGILAEIEKKASEDPHLTDHVRHLKTPVNYFVDDMISQNPKLSFATRWHEERLGYEKDALTGDEAFFKNHLDKELSQQPSKPLAERLLVYYVCLGLGFQGYFFNEPDKLREYMRRILPSIRHWLVENTAEQLMPQAYQHTDTRDFVRPPELKKSLLLAGVCCLLLAGLPLYALLAHHLVGTLEKQRHLREINESHQGVPWSQSRLK